MQREIWIALMINFFFITISPAQSIIKVGVDPGHGGRDGGAIGAMGLLEKEVNLCTAFALKKYLEAHKSDEVQFQVYITREGDESLNITERANFFIANDVDLGISLHHNASANKATNRTMDFVFCDKCRTTAGNLAATIIQRVGHSTGLALGPASAPENVRCQGQSFDCDRGDVDGVGKANFGMVRLPEMQGIPSVLVEVSFISHANEEARLECKDYLDGNGWAIYAGLLDWLNFPPVARLPDNGDVKPIFYSVLDLGHLPDFPNSEARAVNASGQIAGQAWSADFNSVRAFLYTDSDGMIDLGLLPGDESSVALGMNTFGEVVGASLVCADCDAHAFVAVCEKEGLFSLGAFPGAAQSGAHDINACGQVVGFSHHPDPPTVRAFRYTEGVGLEDLGSLGAVSTAEAINDLGWVVGSSTGQAFLYTDEDGMKGLGWLGSGAVSKATGINNSGQICGYSNTVSSQLGGWRRAFLTTREAPAMQDLGVLSPFTRSEATAINAYGHVVGSSYDPGGDVHAFRYTASEGILDLNDLIDPSLGWELKWAHDINDAGQIVGWGLHLGQQRAFRLTPMDEPTGITSPSSSSQDPKGFALSQNYPNPFNPSTAINYQIPKTAHVSVSIYNFLGQKVTTLVDKKQDAGFYQIHWDGKDDKKHQVAGGLYILQLTTPDYIQTKKVIHLK
ncbi:MAG: N-acetylmuramoyl-L-alanine amidase [bacterium]